jgi:putative ABC transport system ATP-binding protein
MVAALACHNLTKTYGRGALAERALADVTLAFRRAETCVMLGPSGSGKTTLLSIMGCLLSPTNGTVEIDGTAIDFSSPARLTRLRRMTIGFVFQHAQLLPFLSVRENLGIVLRNSGIASRDSGDRLAVVLERLGITDYAHRKPGELSGGQRQRVAIARAVLHRPRIILADEPTAALDWENGQAAMRLLVEQAKADEALLVTVTHDTRLLELFDRVIRLEAGKVLET